MAGGSDARLLRQARTQPIPRQLTIDSSANCSASFTRSTARLVLLLDPRAVLDEGGHGFKGWAPTNLHRPVSRLDDRQGGSSVLSRHHDGGAGCAARQQPFDRGTEIRPDPLARIVQAIDFNDMNTRRANPEGVFLIPIGTESESGTGGEGRRRAGQRPPLQRPRVPADTRRNIRTGSSSDRART